MRELRASAFGWLMGIKPGSGMALQFIFAGIAYIMIVVVVILFVPAVRNLEDRLPDHDQMARLEEPSSPEMAGPKSA